MLMVEILVFTQVQLLCLPMLCDNGELDDEIIAAGDQHRLEISGGTHASMMSLENPEQIVSIAPAEGQKPLFIMSDSKFELMSNYP